MPLGMTTGAANRTDIFLITAETLATTPAITFDRTYGSSFANSTAIISGKTGGTLTLDQSGNDSDVTAFLAANASESTDAATTENFENGVLDTVGSSTVLGAFAITYGAVSGGKYQITYGVGTVTVGDYETRFNTRTKRPITFNYIEWNGADDLTIPADVWQGTILDKVSPSPALPTSLAVGVASVETWLKSV